MRLDLLALVPLAIGHLALFVLLINVVHALGHGGKLLDQFKVVALAGFAAGSAVLAWEAWTSPINAWSWPSLIYGAFCVLTGLIVLPACTAFLHNRPRPDGIQGQEVEIDLAESLGEANVIGQGKYAWMLKLPGNESLRLSKVEVELALPNLPRALDGLSILHISDLHFSPAYDRRYFEAVFAECDGWESDLVAFTGDLVDSDETVDWVVPLFSKLRGRLGAFSILGNHDAEHQPDRLRDVLSEAGFLSLEGRWETVESQGVTIALGGTSYPWGPPLPLADKPRADYRIFLCHSPDQYYRAEKAGFNLMLSGHNHGGQIRLPLLGAIFMPSVYSRRFDRGFFRKNDLTLHVSQGVGAKHPIRYGCTPEITRLVLRSLVDRKNEPNLHFAEPRPVSGMRER
jgi:uncharacterized protein